VSEELKMKMCNRGVRVVAVLTGVAVATSALVPMQAAHAADKEKTYKTGAVVLGALGAVLAVKGKTLPAVIAGAGAYYAYKKGKDADNERTAGDVYPNSTRTTRRSGGARSGSTFPQGRRSENRRTDRRSENRRNEATRNDDTYTEDVIAEDLPEAYPSEDDRSNDTYANNYPDDPGYIGLTEKSRDSKTAIALK
jgi:hypothetical protein